MEHLLDVKNLSTEFNIDGTHLKAVDDVSYHIDKGEIVSFVGESGCGKSVTHMSGLQLIPTPPGKITGGEVIYKGIDLLKLKPDGEEIRKIRGGEIGFIFQEPMTSLNPVLTIGEQIMESIILHLKVGRAEARRRTIDMLKKVGIPDAESRIDDYPHQFSGGMRQRLMIAMVLSVNPKIVIADEVTTALDVTTQAQILELLRDIVKSMDTSLILVTHNLGVVARYAERIYVMYAGTVVETGTTKEIFNNPRHPYTIGLMNAVPRLDDPKDKKLVPVEGLPPNLANKKDQCPFLPRCVFRTEECHSSPAPSLNEVREGHAAACYVDVSKVQNNNIVEDEVASSMIVGEQEKPIINEPALPEENLLEVNHLKMYFPVTKSIFKRKVGEVKAVDDVSFYLKQGETLGLVGESGCGKSTVARAILRLYNPSEGEINFQGQDISKMRKKVLRPLRRNISMIFQDPFSSLDPRQTAESVVGEPLIVHNLVNNRNEYTQRVDELFRMVGLDPALKNRVPHEFSGGQRQRIGIARALASEPSLIVCDEAISALDVSIQAQIINLLESLKEQLNLSYLFIAHDLSVVRHISDRVAVMYLGRIVETADWETLYDNPKHPYTKALLGAVPIPDPFIEEEREHVVLKGEVPSPLNRPTGCSFHNRCPIATPECKTIDPSLSEIEDGHEVACINI
ncbi:MULTISPECIES: ABC transporter ATP-binding protein [Bacillaceae]|uniref:ABC transporter ATP-binding protein n=1 Tax=Evansella alkalicola TaxID=745819 RepID=A0ABS6JXF1_9BACI|nr:MULTISPECIES: ABC transporter ATP-binding protein [Bacillaceae]MBU9723183.1 ABC transporter ATP-binding protein [Bacillus alkalicola]